MHFPNHYVWYLCHFFGGVDGMYWCGMLYPAKNWTTVFCFIDMSPIYETHRVLAIVEVPFME